MAPFQNPANEALMRAYLAGDAHAFEELYRRTAPRIYGYLVRLTRSRSLADDLLQVTFTKAHRARETFAQGAEVMPWLFSIARRSFLDDRRRARHRQEELTRAGDLPDSAPTTRAESDLPDEVHAALQALPASYREAIELTKFAELSNAQAAAVLGTTESAVKLRVHRGYEKLRQLLAAPTASSDAPSSAR